MGENSNFLRDHKHKEGSFILGNIAGHEWQMLKEGKFYSANASGEESNNLVAISNRDGIEDHKMLRKKIVAVIRQNIHSSISSVIKLVEKAGYKDFDIDYDEIVKMLKLKSYELFEE